MSDYQVDERRFANDDAKYWCVITGGSSGLGKEFAKLAAINGYQIINISRRPLRINSHIATKDVNIKNISADLSTREGLSCAIKLLEKHGGEIRLFINSAGAMYTGRVGSYDPEKIADFLQLTVISPTTLCNALAQRDCEGLHVLNIGSMCSIRAGYGTAFNSIYSSAKRYADFFFSCIGEEFNRQGRPVSVSTAHPGPLDTDFDNTWRSEKKGITARWIYGKLNTSLAAHEIWEACIVNNEKRFIRKNEILKLCAWRLRRLADWGAMFKGRKRTKSGLKL